MTKVDCEARGAKSRPVSRNNNRLMTIRNLGPLKQVRTRVAGLRQMPNGDPPTVMLWGAEE